MKDGLAGDGVDASGFVPLPDVLRRPHDGSSAASFEAITLKYKKTLNPNNGIGRPRIKNDLAA